MPQPTNKLTQFWNELKRRKVVRVIIVYAAAAFVILETVDIITPALLLPSWTVTFIIVLLAIGFPIAIIFSWIFDITPEGVKKTKPVTQSRSEEKQATPGGWKISTYISVLIIIAFVVFYVISNIKQSSEISKMEKSIAVLPFYYYNIDEKSEDIGDAFSNEIITQLYKINGFDRIISHTSTLQYKGSDKPPIPVIGKELDVNFIIEGSLERQNENVSVQVQVILAANDDHIWADEFKGKWNDIFTIRTNIAKKVASELKTILTLEEIEQIEKRPTKNLEAYDFYLLGVHYFNNFSHDEDLWRAIEYFQQALDIDSTYALAYSGLAEVYNQLIVYAILSPNEAYPKVKAYSTKALELNEELANPHCLLGIVNQSFEYDFTGVEKEYIRALEINPSSSFAHEYYAHYLSVIGRHDEAISHANLALKLDPLSISAKSNKYFTLFNAGYKNEALKLMEEARDSDPDYPYWYWDCALFYINLGMYNEALSMLQTQLTLMGDDNISDEIGLLGYIYGRLDQKDKAQKQLDRLDELSSKGFYVSPRTRVWVYMGLDNLDKAIEILEEAYKNHSIESSFLRLYEYDALRNDPRFIELLKKVGLEK